MKTKLLGLVVLFLLASGLPVAAEEAATPARATFRGELVKVGVLTPSTGGCVPTHPYPLFFVNVRLTEPPAAPLEWKQGEAVALGVHSLEALFGGEPTEGAVYAFSIGVRRKNGKLRYADLKVASGPPGK